MIKRTKETKVRYRHQYRSSIKKLQRRLGNAIKKGAIKDEFARDVETDHLQIDQYVTHLENENWELRCMVNNYKYQLNDHITKLKLKYLKKGVDITTIEMTILHRRPLTFCEIVHIRWHWMIEKNMILIERDVNKSAYDAQQKNLI